MKAHYNFYFTMTYNEVSKLSMFFYLIIVILIGVLDGALYDVIKWLMGLL